MIERLHQIFENLDSRGPGCAFAARFDGEPVMKGAVGLADLESGESITPATVFNVASCSKQFTAFALLLLEEGGMLDLDDNISKFVPELGESAAHVKLRHLIHHTGGLPDYMEMAENAGISDQDILTSHQALHIIANHNFLRFPAGTKFEYSNTGYFLLSLVIERTSGMSQREFSADHLFGPLKMNDTTFVDRYPAGIHIARGYQLLPDSGYRIYESPWEMTGDGQVHTTVEDLMKWGRNFSSGEVGGLRLVQRMGELRDESPEKEICESATYLMGLESVILHGHPILEHAGSWAGYNAHFIRINTLGLTVAVAGNCEQFDAEEYARKIAQVLCAAKA